MTYSEPVLHDLSTVLLAPQAVLSERGGDLDGGAQGFFSRDRRHLRRLVVTVDGRRLSAVGRREEATAAVYESVDPVTNYLPMDGPSLHLVRRRELTAAGFIDELTFVNQGLHPCAFVVEVDAESDLADMNIVRSGLDAEAVAPTLTPAGLLWQSSGRSTELVAEPAPEGSATRPSGATLLRWEMALAPGEPETIRLAIVAGDASAGALVLDSPRDAMDFSGDPVSARGGAADRLLVRSTDDLRALLLVDRRYPADVFPAAGSPWYFTLFGRDSIWTSLLVHDVAPDLARGTLAALERYQGTGTDAASEEQPGRIPHEVRSAPVQVYGVLDLPPVYYGNIDTTALWVILAYRVWVSDGRPPLSDAVASSVRAALNWIAQYGDSDSDFLVEYAGSAGAGLAHQAWKDSPTGIRHADGREVTGPIAACEVQGYAYAAAVAGAELLESSSGPEAASWRSWAEALRDRFRSVFWTSDARGRYPALALDGDKNVVEGAASNMAHLLGTGLLAPDEVAAVVERMREPDLDSGYGLRTLSSDVAAYSALSYHRGSVWPHDTAIAIRGLLLEGYSDDARRLAHGLVRASEAFDGRLPELYGGNPAGGDLPLTTYPTACFPQAWAAAAGIVAVRALDGAQ